MKPMYHIGFDDSHKAKYAILPGDPGRVERIAALLDEPRFFHGGSLTSPEASW